VTGKLYRLPTEAEWEYAARAGTTTTYSFGDDISKLNEHAWFSGNSEGKTHPVGQKKTNPRDLFDMHGNVWEWVEDDWHGNYKGAWDDGRAWVDDPRGAVRVIRGGSWSNDARRCRAAFRFYDPPGIRYYSLGFRLARSVALGP
jgi:formylglycine-generating enzyme required for sulfatase activity